MQILIQALDATIALLRLGFLLVGVVVVVLCVLDWAVRTRRINQFGAVARFTRRVVDPLVSAVERRIVRAGGNPTSAPWWTIVFVVFTGLIVLALLTFLRNSIVEVYYSVASGPMGVVRLLVAWTFTVLQLAIIVRVITSWVGGTYSKIGRLAFHLTEWMLRPMRRWIPTFGGLDVTPILAWFLISIVQGAVLRALAP